MKVVILAGGYGTRISEESHLKPKPMIEIGGYPILWHIMKFYSSYGFNDFIICCGYKQYVIKEYFSNYFIHNSDVTFDFTKDDYMEIHRNKSEPWRVTLIDTGLETMTGGRIKRILQYVDNEPFMMTYGDGLSDVNLDELIKLHNEKKRILTLTAISQKSRFGMLDIEDNVVSAFREKAIYDSVWINGGFMILEPEIDKYLDNDTTILEKQPLERLSADNQMIAYKHDGFWQCMDTMRDKEVLDKLWNENKAPWKRWQ